MKRIFAFAFLILNYEVNSQIIRSPIGLLGRPITETIIEAPRYINQPQIIAEQPCNIGNYPITVPNLPITIPNIPISNPNIPITVTNLPISRPNLINQIATECTPSVCKDLANTIQIMTVANLIQNTQSDKLAAKLANPMFRDIISSPVLPCGCPNPIYNQIQIAKIAPNRQIAQKVVAREVVGPIVGPNGAPNVILPNIGAPNSPKVFAQIPELDGRVNSAVLKNILQILGNGI